MLDPSRVGNGLVKPWSNLVRLLVKLGQRWENLVGFQEMHPKPRFEVI